MKTFSFRYPQRKTSHGLKSGDRAGHSTSPRKRDQTPREQQQQQQSPDVHLSNPLWVLTTVEANQPHDTTPTLTPLQPSQCPFEKWEIFMPHPVFSHQKRTPSVCIIKCVCSCSLGKGSMIILRMT